MLHGALDIKWERNNMKKKQSKEEYQHFIFTDNTNGEVVEIKIGPTPIKYVDMWNKIKDAMIASGHIFTVPPEEKWTITKAWSE